MVEIRKIEEVWGGVDIPEITGVYDPLSGLERRDYYIAGTDCCFGLQSEPLCVGEYQIVPGDTCQTGTGDRYQACVYVL